ncbi:alpha/beta hydrolase [Paraflavitalea speifideaquila]|uniref:alpha/beta fold hydrolase n=1 Tax=Paraflavitalea speifideaquila TaxID=3076558 RepID=UPI0028EC3D94|nr:alpha/beta hydrolase [Paraflavitalea speifideiaquila]
MSYEPYATESKNWFPVCWLSLLYTIKGYSHTTTKFSDTLHQQLIDIGHHKLFITERGKKEAKFTVVFEAGGGGNSKDWEKVLAILPPDTRAIAYDRAGFGKSERGPLPRTMAQEVFELHALIKTLKIKGPVILVGQSLGGLLVRLYTEQYGKNIVGVLLVDPAHESGMFGSMKYGGWVRLREKAAGKPVPKPQLKKTISPGYDSTADYMAEEFQYIYLSGMKTPNQLKDRPVIIIGAGIRNPPPGTPDEQWKELRAERDKQVQDLTALSSNSKFILDPKSSHMVQKDNPEIIVSAIQMIMDSITAKTRL